MSFKRRCACLERETSDRTGSLCFLPLLKIPLPMCIQTWIRAKYWNPTFFQTVIPPSSTGSCLLTKIGHYFVYYGWQINRTAFPPTLMAIPMSGLFNTCRETNRANHLLWTLIREKHAAKLARCTAIVQYGAHLLTLWTLYLYVYYTLFCYRILHHK